MDSRIKTGIGDRISIAEAVAFCIANNVQLTKQGLIYIGRKEGWITGEGRESIVDVVRLKEYIEQLMPPKGWIPIAYRPEFRNEITHYKYYAVLHDAKLEIRYYGKGRKAHAQESNLRKLFKGYRIYN